MPPRRCRRSLAKELAHAPDQSPSGSQRPKRKATNQQSLDNLAAKKYKFEDETVKEVKTKSFYGKSSSRYLNPIERRDIPKLSDTGKEIEKKVPLRQSKINNVIGKGKAGKKTKKRVKKPLTIIKSSTRKEEEKECVKKEELVSSQKENAAVSSPVKTVSSTKKFFKSRTSPRKRSASLGMGKAAVSIHRSKGFQIKLQAKGKLSVKDTIAQSLVTRSTGKAARRSFAPLGKVSSTISASHLSPFNGDSIFGKQQEDTTDKIPAPTYKDSDIHTPVDGQALASGLEELPFSQSQDLFSDDSLSNDEVLISNRSQISQQNCSWKAGSEVDSPSKSSVADSVNLLSEVSSLHSESRNEVEAEAADSHNSTGSSGSKSRKTRQLFPIFSRSPKSSPVTRSKSVEKTDDGPGTPSSQGSTQKVPRRSPKHLLRKDKDGKEQMVLDFGQKLGPTQCSCGMTYNHTDPVDTATHSKFHHNVINTLKFPGWKKERVLKEYPDGSRIIVIMHDDKGPMKKVLAVKKIVDEDLGFVVERQPVKEHSKTFMFISHEKRIVGFCIGQLISQGYRVVDQGQASQGRPKTGDKQPWCCSTDSEPAKCGINRIWTLRGERRHGVASKLLDVVRQNFLMGYLLDKSEMAFSDPTPDGMSFAAKYTGTPTFLVYKQA